MNGSRTPLQLITHYVGIAIVVAVIAAGIYHLFFKGPTEVIGKAKNESIDLANKSYNQAKRIAKDFDKVLHFCPRITTNGQTVVLATQPIVELSLTEKRIDYTYSWAHTQLGSTKRIKLKGYFVAKAGYDLTKPFAIDVSNGGQTIRATMPPAKLNSFEQTSIEILQDENGYWNNIKSEDRQNAMNALNAEARRSLDETTLLTDANSALMALLVKAVRTNSATASIINGPFPLP